MNNKYFSHTAKQLDARVAREIAQQAGKVSISVGSIDLESASALSHFEGELIRLESELPQLEEGCAEYLVKLGSAGRLEIAWLRDHECGLDRSTFLALAPFADSVALQTFDELDASEAEILGQCHGTQLLVHVKTMSVGAAKGLAKASVECLSVELPHLSTEVASALSASEAQDLFQIFIRDGTFDTESAKALSSFAGCRMTLSASVLPSVEAMVALGSFDGLLELTMPIITRELAIALADSEGEAELWLTETPSADVLEVLFNGRRDLVHLDVTPTIDYKVPPSPKVP